MSEHKLDCCVVRDLLPSYIEELTEPETSAQVKEHLETCPPCRAVEANMRAGLTVERAPKPSLNFLKRVKRTRLIACGASGGCTTYRPTTTPTPRPGDWKR